MVGYDVLLARAWPCFTPITPSVRTKLKEATNAHLARFMRSSSLRITAVASLRASSTANAVRLYGADEVREETSAIPRCFLSPHSIPLHLEHSLLIRRSPRTSRSESRQFRVEPDRGALFPETVLGVKLWQFLPASHGRWPPAA